MNKLECILKITPRSLPKLLPSGRCKWVQFAITWLYVKNIYISIEWKLHTRKVAVWRFERHFRHTHAHYFHLSAKPKLCDTIHFTRTRWHQNLGERQGGLKHIVGMRVSFAPPYLQQPLWNQWTNDSIVTQQWLGNSSGSSGVGAAAQCQDPCWALWAPEQHKESPPGPAVMEGTKAPASAERISMLWTASFFNAKVSQYQSVVIGRSKQQWEEKCCLHPQQWGYQGCSSCPEHGSKPLLLNQALFLQRAAAEVHQENIPNDEW